jgi:anti-sigma B factor antagonist
MTELSIEIARPGAELVLSGRLDGRTATRLRAALQEAVDAGNGDLVVRVDRLEIWDAAGLGVFVGAHRRARRTGRRVVLTGVPPREMRLIRVTRLSRVLVVEPAAVGA